MGGDISRPARREDVPGKIGGREKYIADYKFEGMLYAKTFRSTQPRARIKAITYPKLPEGYFIIDKNDVPGRNRVKMITDDLPFFANDIVNYIGEPIAIVVGKDKEEILRLRNEIIVEYEKLEPIFNIEEGIRTAQPIYGEDNCFADYKITKGNIEDAKSKSKYIYEGEYETGFQEQFYLEPQGVTATFKDGKVTIYGSLQCPFYVKSAVMECLGFEADKIRVVQMTTGGAFGGKEDYPSILAGQAACAAIKSGKPVTLILERNEDIEFTTKRHPSKIRLKSYVDEAHRVICMEADILLDAGAYTGLSSVVLQRAMFAAAGVYNIENLLVRGRAVATNKAVSGAFRGFGAPQAFFAIEMHMEHIAKKLSIDSLHFKMLNMVKTGDYSTTGGIFRERILLPELIQRALEISSYENKKKSFGLNKVNGKLRGIGLSLFFHGCGFTGNGEQDHIKGKVKLIKHANGTVDILIANVEMGQGVHTTMRKIVAQALHIPMRKVRFNNPDTDRVLDSGPTVASRTIVIVGKLVLEAAEELKRKWKRKHRLEVTIEYKYPDGFCWDNSNFFGDAYTSYSWGVNVVEVEVDSLTLETSIKGVWAVYDIGKPIDDKIVKGQIDGGIVQGLAYASLEVMENDCGRFKQRSSSDYIVPTALDVPEIISETICEPHKYGPFGAKGLGELTFIGAAPTYALAVEDAFGAEISKIPVRPEHLMGVVKNEK